MRFHACDGHYYGLVRTRQDYSVRRNPYAVYHTTVFKLTGKSFSYAAISPFRPRRQHRGGGGGGRFFSNCDVAPVAFRILRLAQQPDPHVPDAMFGAQYLQEKVVRRARLELVNHNVANAICISITVRPPCLAAFNTSDVRCPPPPPTSSAFCNGIKLELGSIFIIVGAHFLSMPIVIMESSHLGMYNTYTVKNKNYIIRSHCLSVRKFWCSYVKSSVKSTKITIQHCEAKSMCLVLWTDYKSVISNFIMVYLLSNIRGSQTCAAID
jgi:hypothetical protein